ncbi:MAG: VOC family protein [Planctomycetota bacterium]|nr:VOC family protein [Planctomycetota bacterium]
MLKTIVPALRYRDAGAAVAWLGSVFGFETRLLVPGQDGAIEHARLTRGDTMIMLASLGRKGAIEALFQVPAEAGGITQSLYVHTEDPDALYQSAKSAGADILEDIHDFEFGGRMFTCRDPEGHVWTFGSNDPWAT